MNLSKQTFRQWLASPEFRKGVAVQVASGLIITAIVTIIGLGIHELRSDSPARPPAVARVAPAPAPAPKPIHRVQRAKRTPEAHAEGHAANDPVAERMQELMMSMGFWVIGALLLLGVVSVLFRAAFGIY